MDPALVILIAAGISFLISIIALGVQEAKDLSSKSTLEVIERRYKRAVLVKRIFFWIGVGLLVVALCIFVGMRWDNLMRNIHWG